MPFLSLGKATAVMHTKHHASPSSYEQFSGGCVEMRVHGDHEVFEQEASLIFLPPFREVEAQATRAWRQGKRDVEQVR
jgi:hypothetical protein